MTDPFHVESWLWICVCVWALNFLFCHVPADENDNLLQGINAYRVSLNLTALKKNDNAECLAGELADQFKDQPCTNTTGSNTVPGTEPQFSDYQDLLTKCHLNATVTRDGNPMPACVPNLDPSLVLSNYTMSQYSKSLNDTTYTGAGIGSKNNWIVVILTTDTSTGNFAPSSSSSSNAASLVSRIGFIYHLMFLLMGYVFLL